jgi:hypothetical protein
VILILQVAKGEKEVRILKQWVVEIVTAILRI